MANALSTVVRVPAGIVEQLEHGFVAATLLLGSLLTEVCGLCASYC